MKILVLGDSDSAGRHTDGAPWPELLRQSLEASPGTTVTIESAAFSPVSPNGGDYCERKAREAQPDAVVLLVASFPFVAGFVWLRVERLFGKRAGRWYKKLEDGFDSGTKGRGQGRDTLNRLARKVIQRLVGRMPYASRQTVTANYQDAFRALSRLEDVEVVLFGYPGMSEAANRGKAPAERKRFFADMREAARAHHFRWVDGMELFSGIERDDVMADPFHFNARGHGIIARAVEEALNQSA